MTDYWHLLPLYKGETVFLLGGGPSLSRRDLDLECLRDHRVIAINNSAYVAPWASILFFRDLKWYFANGEIVDNWKGTVVTSTKSDKYPDNIRVIKLLHSTSFVNLVVNGIQYGQTFKYNAVRYGRSSGHIALSLAVSLGASRVVLLGYDCRIVNGRSHFHDKVENSGTAQTSVLYEKDFLPAWKGWNDYCTEAGTQVLNATPGSAIQEFPFMSLDEILSK